MPHPQPCRHFAKEIIAQQLEKPDEESVALLYRKIYDRFVEAFDANDNGISAYPSEIKPLFHRSWDIFAQVNILNPDWNEDNVDIQERFLQAVQLVRSNFEAVLKKYTKSWLLGRSILERCLLAVPMDDATSPESQILVLDQFCPWQDHLFDLEGDKGVKNPILYALYEDSMKRSWRVHAVPKGPDTFECRLALPETWRGLRDQELSDASGISGCVFVHRGGFIGAHATKEGAMEMAKQSLKLQQ